MTARRGVIKGGIGLSLMPVLTPMSELLAASHISIRLAIYDDQLKAGRAFGQLTFW